MAAGYECLSGARTGAGTAPKYFFTRRAPLRLLTPGLIGFAIAGLILTLCATAAGAADAAAGKAIYSAKCRQCHGANGEGNPSIAKMMKVELKPLSESTADLKKVVTEGQGKMKPVAGVSGADLDNLVAYVQSLKK
jgi:mono/diheme cytochrome c family protein